MIDASPNTLPEEPAQKQQLTSARARLLRHGAHALSDAELLALVTRIPGGTPAAERILNARGGLRTLAINSPRSASPAGGLGLGRSVVLAAAVELGRRVLQPTSSRPVVNSPDAAYGYLHPILQSLRNEVFHVLCLNSRHALLLDVRVSEGSVSSCPAQPRDVFSSALACGASSIILAHNHPSGSPEPSPEDVELTQKLADAGNLLGIKVLDHLILGDGRYVSLNERSLIRTSPRSKASR